MGVPVDVPNVTFPMGVPVDVPNVKFPMGVPVDVANVMFPMGVPMARFPERGGMGFTQECVCGYLPSCN
jgi:hypothetical protein